MLNKKMLERGFGWHCSEDIWGALPYVWCQYLKRTLKSHIQKQRALTFGIEIVIFLSYVWLDGCLK